MANKDNWGLPPSNCTLKQHECHVWQVRVPEDKILYSVLWPLLSGDEQARALRFYFEKDRECFVWARGYLRLILSRYTASKPEDIQFDYSEYGKPLLKTVQNTRGIEFNVSHSQACILIAVTQGQALGVDVELIKPKDDCLHIAERFFHKEEYHALSVLSGDERARGFYRIWTQKEAFVKALGLGLSHNLKHFAVSAELKGLLRIDHSQRDVLAWQLPVFELGDDYIAAVAIRDILAKFVFFSCLGTA